MSQMSDRPFRYVYLSPRVMEAARLPDPVRRAAWELPEYPAALDKEADRGLVVVLAGEVVERGRAAVPDWVDAQTRYLIIVDIPEPAVLRLPTILRIHKPDRRMHLARDPDAVKRQVIALERDVPLEGIVDAYLLGRTLNVVLGDMSFQSVAAERVPALVRLDDEQLRAFEIHASGSYLHWPEQDLRIGASQLLQAVDPTYLAEVEIERYAVEKTSLALRTMRTDRGLKQSDIRGLSERHVRRLEKEEARLTVEAAEAYADAFGLSLSEFVHELSRVLSALRDDDPTSEADPRTDSTAAA